MFDAAVTRAVALGSHDGRLEADLTDERPWACYKLALAHADLMVACIVAEREPQALPLEVAAPLSDGDLGRSSEGKLD